jgi:hypothetical protein
MDLFISLPIASLDRMALGKEVRRMGTVSK